jgi:hypothetical protein
LNPANISGDSGIDSGRFRHNQDRHSHNPSRWCPSVLPWQ